MTQPSGQNPPSGTARGPGRKSSPPSRKAASAFERKEPAVNSEAHQITFRYANPNAREVRVSGSFNEWQQPGEPLVRDREGNWSAEFFLPPGTYEYRYLVDGEWRDDPKADRFSANPYGGLNCVLEVKPAGSHTPA